MTLYILDITPSLHCLTGDHIMKLQHSPDNFSSSLLLWPADWKFENIWHDTDLICGPLIGPSNLTEPSHWPLVTIPAFHWPLVTIPASHWPECHNTGLWLAADTWACLWESRSLQTELSLPRTLLHWALTRDRCRHQLCALITFRKTFIMGQRCAIGRLGTWGHQVSYTWCHSSWWKTLIVKFRFWINLKLCNCRDKPSWFNVVANALQYNANGQHLNKWFISSIISLTCFEKAFFVPITCYIERPLHWTACERRTLLGSGRQSMAWPRPGLAPSIR